MDKLVEIEDSRYHIEFQLLAGRMAIRMYEYGVRETLRGIYQSFEMNKTNSHVNTGI